MGSFWSDDDSIMIVRERMIARVNCVENPIERKAIAAD